MSSFSPCSNKFSGDSDILTCRESSAEVLYLLLTMDHHSLMIVNATESRSGWMTQTNQSIDIFIDFNQLH
jgi:hypothetical protein